MNLLALLTIFLSSPWEPTRATVTVRPPDGWRGEICIEVLSGERHEYLSCFQWTDKNSFSETRTYVLLAGQSDVRLMLNGVYVTPKKEVMVLEHEECAIRREKNLPCS